MGKQIKSVCLIIYLYQKNQKKISLKNLIIFLKVSPIFQKKLTNELIDTAIMYNSYLTPHSIGNYELCFSIRKYSFGSTMSRFG